MRILLVCNAGMSTGIMQLKLEEEAQKVGVEASIEAIPISDIEKNLDGTDAILLGPQVRFAEKDIKKMVKDTIPVMVIEVQDFGMMRADHVWSKLQTKMKGYKFGKNHKNAGNHIFRCVSGIFFRKLHQLHQFVQNFGSVHGAKILRSDCHDWDRTSLFFDVIQCKTDLRSKKDRIGSVQMLIQFYHRICVNSSLQISLSCFLFQLLHHHTGAHSQVT